MGLGLGFGLGLGLGLRRTLVATCCATLALMAGSMLT